MTPPLQNSRWLVVGGPARARGFTLIELMIALLVSLLLLLGLTGLFVGMSRSSDELKKANDLIENGRFAAQALASELSHSAFWGGYVPQFDSLVEGGVPVDAPTAIPNPCLAYSAWDAGHVTNLIGVPIQTSDVLPSGAGCLSPLVKRAGTDVVITRNLDRCVPGTANCDADVLGRLYMQSTQCVPELNIQIVASATANTLVLVPAKSSGIDGVYKGIMIRIKSGTGAGQVRYVTGYVGATRTATVAPAWTVVPDTTTVFAADYVLGNALHPLHTRACVGTGTPPALPITGGPFSPKRRFQSNIYYISEFPHPNRPGETIPTLVRSSIDLAGGVIAHQAPTPLVSGIEVLRIQLGIDDFSDSGAAVDYTVGRIWSDPNNQVSPINRGDGSPDRYVRCTTAVPCTANDLANAVSAKIYVLVRARDRTPGYVDNKTYCLGELNLDGSCPADSLIAAANDAYQRHMFSTNVRLINVSGRRETPS